MKLMILVPCILLSATGVISYDASCCEEGLKYGEEIFKNGDTKCVDNSKKRDAYCNMLFSQCCQHKLDNTFCNVGRSLSLAGLFCVEGDSTVQKYKDVQRTCCECCASGKRAGERKQSCNYQGNTDKQYCRLSYKACCEQVKKTKEQTSRTPIPQRTWTTPTTPAPTKIAATTRRIFGRRCAEVKCEAETSLGCHVTDDGVSRCKCKPGYYNYARFICKLSDECRREGGKKCGKNFCMIVKGTARCYLNCPSPKYRATFSHGRRICEDVDECALKISRCNLDTQDCVNIVGGYRCKRMRCAKGLKMQGGRCVDVDECEENRDICGKGTCQNYHGSFFCQCQRGYVLNDQTKKCVDIDECALHHRQYCDYKCINTEGSFKCSCPKGYKLLGEDCIDINECEESPSVCPKQSYCFNTHGSYMCITQTCPSTEYYTQDPVKGEPDVCKKVCDETTDLYSRCSLGIAPQSIKRIAYKYEKTIGIGRFTYKYWWNFPQEQYQVNIKLIQGNNLGEFEVQFTKSNEIQIKNIKEINGPRRIYMAMKMDVKQKILGNPLRWRYMTEFFIDISEHAFSIR